ncbi:E3 ubiquitin-protein ligase RNF128 [Trichomycterus rosablanca]|uniref:E3 ubiquitin-protein ligase RNF128 n=1 Tax=Trichomycterus rosablanca TaxID=2290929 RepID=UPI002F35BF07
MSWGSRGTLGFKWIWVSLWILQPQVCLGSMIVWTAYVELSYFNTGTNQTQISVCECGVYGSNSPLGRAAGFVALPDSDPLACQPNTTFSISHKPWIALIKRGNCTHAEKILAAQKAGAAAVVIYNLDGTGNGTNTMSHPGTGDIVAIMIGNILGREITELVKGGTEVFMGIEVANPHGPWINPFWVYVMSFTFFSITAVILGYFTFVMIKRLYRNRQLRLQQQELKKVAKKAIAKLQVRTLRRNDPEVESDEMSCAVCIDMFKRCDVVTTLPCSHIFHKTCIEQWLLEHHTCPMCKYDILKREVGVQRTQEAHSESADVTFYPVSVSGLMNPPDVVSFSQLQEQSRLHTDEMVLQVPDLAREDQNSKTDQTYTNAAFEHEQEKQQSSYQQSANAPTQRV